jgi:hypothetical protein
LSGCRAEKKPRWGGGRITAVVEEARMTELYKKWGLRFSETATRKGPVKRECLFKAFESCASGVKPPKQITSTNRIRILSVRERNDNDSCPPTVV